MAKLDEDADTDQIEHLKILQAIAIAARAIQVSAIATASWSEIVNNVEFLELNGHSCIPAVQLAISRKSARASFADGDIEQWADAVIIAPRGGRWSVRNPRFSDCDSLLKFDQNRDEPSLLEQLHQAILTDGFVKLVSCAGYTNTQGGSAMKELGNIGMTFLRHFEKSEQALAEARKNLIMPVIRLMRALVAIAVPMPGIHSVSLEDVEYAAPKNGTEAKIMKDIPKLGRIVALKLREKDSNWENP